MQNIVQLDNYATLLLVVSKVKGYFFLEADPLIYLTVFAESTYHFLPV